MMTKKDFIILAEYIKEHNEHNSRFGTPAFTKDQLDVLATFCGSTNYLFKRQQWLDYIAGKCGPNGGKVR